jgi:hypothetical protein
LKAAVELVAGRRQLDQQARTKRSPSGWLAAAKRGIRDELDGLTGTPTELADQIEPPAAVRPSCAVCHSSGWVIHDGTLEAVRCECRAVS